VSNPATIPEEQWVKTATAAALIGVRPETLLTWHKRGLHGLPQPRHLNSKSYRWPKLALLRWMAESGAKEGDGDAA
jgi:hypothetical protein